MRTIKQKKIRNSRFQIPDSGYTLIEILVSLTIIGLLFGIGYVNFRDFSRRQAIAGAAKKIQGDLNLTQQLALSGQKPDDINCNPPNLLSGYNFKIIPPSEYVIEANCTGSSTAVIYKNVALSSDIIISSDSLTTISFKVLGQGTNIVQGGSVVLTLTQSQTKNKFDITIGAGGNIQ